MGWVSAKRLSLAACTALALTSCAAAHYQASEPRPIVFAGGEQLRGVRLNNNVRVFRGIPYAAPPLGPLRWAPPRPHDPRPGIQNATDFGPACPQDQGNTDWYRTVATAMGSSGDVVPELTNISEDCLVLNVWAPSPDHERPRSGWPVMAWIHGGSNVNGFSHEPNYLGHKLAERGVVAVSVNYRLGLLGFFAHPSLGEDASGRQGLDDQIAALRWVRANAAAFGGDPRNVTVFGESAGGTNIQALMHMQEARGLFRRAIIQSGYLGSDGLATQAAAAAVATQLMSAPTSAQVLREMTWVELVRLRARELPGHFFAPVVDPSQNFHVPLMIGSNRDEGRMYLSSDVASDFREALSIVPLDRREAVGAYLSDLTPDQKTRADYLQSGPGFLCPTVQLADIAIRNGNASFVYLFTRVRPGAHNLGAYHGAEIPYVFNTADAWLPGDARDRTLTLRMIRYWVNFAAVGDPNGAGLPHWPSAETGQAMELGRRTGPLGRDTFALCALLQGR